MFESEQGEIQYAALTPEREEKPKTKRIEEIDLHEHELIGYDTYREIIEELKAGSWNRSVPDCGILYRT